MANYPQTRRQPRQRNKEELAQDDWAIHTEDEGTKKALERHALKRGIQEFPTTTIHYLGDEMVVSLVPFELVDLLTLIRIRKSYDFIPLHRLKNSPGWKIWKEQKRSPSGHLKSHLEKRAREIV